MGTDKDDTAVLASHLREAMAQEETELQARLHALEERLLSLEKQCLDNMREIADVGSYREAIHKTSNLLVVQNAELKETIKALEARLDRFDEQSIRQAALVADELRRRLAGSQLPTAAANPGVCGQTPSKEYIATMAGVKVVERERAEAARIALIHQQLAERVPMVVSHGDRVYFLRPVDPSGCAAYWHGLVVDSGDLLHLNLVPKNGVSFPLTEADVFQQLKSGEWKIKRLIHWKPGRLEYA